MAKKYEFRPDPDGSGNLGKLLLTKKQRRSLLRWTLFGLVCLVGLLLQDAILCRAYVMGARPDVVPCLILMVCVLQGVESGSVFTLVAACAYYFTGSAPGPYVIPILVVIAVFLVILRQNYLQQGFITILLCAGAGMLVYEMCLFGINLFLGRTLPARMGVFLLSVALSLIAVPVAYPILKAIGKIGGDTWKE